MKSYLLLVAAALVHASAALPNLSPRYNNDPLVVDLGEGGVYKAGYAYNDTVRYWRGELPHMRPMHVSDSVFQVFLMPLRPSGKPHYILVDGC